MDPLLKRRLFMELIVHPYTGTVDGDAQYGESVLVSGNIIHGVNRTLSVRGEEVTFDTVIYIDGQYHDVVSVQDTIEGRYLDVAEIKHVRSYFKGPDTCSLMEVYV